MAATRREVTKQARRCGVCGGSVVSVRLHRHGLAARITGRGAGHPDVQWGHRDGRQHVIAGGAGLPKYAALAQYLTKIGAVEGAAGAR